MASLSLTAALGAAAAGFFGVAAAAGAGGVPAGGCCACASSAPAVKAAAVPRRSETRPRCGGGNVIWFFPFRVSLGFRRWFLGGEYGEFLVAELALRHRVLRPVELRRCDVQA